MTLVPLSFTETFMIILKLQSGCTINVLIGYTNLVKHANHTNPTGFHMAMLKDYIRCLDSLKDAYRCKETDLLKTVLGLWVSIGDALDIDLLLHRTGEARNLLRPLQWKGCNYYRCICNDVPPCHKMKVCKGCWRVRYCCAECQKRCAHSSHMHLLRYRPYVIYI